MTLGIVLAGIALLVALVLLSRQSKKNKKLAIEDLARERDNVGTFDIFALVESEVQALGLTEIEGAHGLPHDVLLKVWSANQSIVDSCSDSANLRYVVALGVEPAKATDNDVTLECT